MRQKHFAALALVIWLGVVAWVSSMVVVKPQVFGGQSLEADGAVAEQIRRELQQADQMRAALATLNAPVRTAAVGQIVALPPTMAQAEAEAVTIDGSPLAEPGVRVVSFIISGDSVASRAMIDGKIVGRGARLSDGTVVRSIGSQAVRLEDSSGQIQTLEVRLPSDPRNSARVKP